MEYKLKNPKNRNIVEISTNIKPKNVLIPEPIIKGKNKMSPNSSSLLMKAIMKKNNPMEKNMMDNR